jgi:hypothetical protein
MRPEKTQQSPSRTNVIDTIIRVFCLNSMLPIFPVLLFLRIIAAHYNALDRTLGRRYTLHPFLSLLSLGCRAGREMIKNNSTM